MKRLKWHNKHSDSRYRLRFLACLILAELIMLAVIFWGPVSKREKQAYVAFEPEATPIMKTPVITYQSSNVAPPPAPQVPVEVPDDQIIKNEKIDFQEFDDIGNSDSLGLSIGNTGGISNKIYTSPALAPSIVYIVEPTVDNKTDEKALIYVSFLVDKKGNVEEATIKRILLFNDQGKPDIEVKDINERVLSAIIKAAMQWKFQPAKVDGHPVRALTLQTFTVDY